MINLIHLKKLISLKNIIITFLISFLLFLIIGKENNSFLEVLETSFLINFSNSSIIHTLKWLLHKGILIYMLISILAFEKNHILKYEIIRYRKPILLILNKIILIFIYISSFYLLIFLGQAFFYIISNKTLISTIEFKNIFILFFELILINFFSGVITFVFVIISNNKFAFFSIIFIDLLYMLFGNNLLYNLYYSNNVNEMNLLTLFKLSYYIIIFLIIILLFLWKYTCNNPLTD